MRVRLMFPDRDFEVPERLPRAREEPAGDLALDTLLNTMSEGDPFLRKVARTALVLGVENDAETIRYRQAIMVDCLRNPALVRELYALTVETMEQRRKSVFFGLNIRHPRGSLSSAVGVLELLVEMLRKLRAAIVRNPAPCSSLGFSALLATLGRELDDEYLASVEEQLRGMHFRKGVLLSAALGSHNESADLVLRQPWSRPSWLRRLRGEARPGYTIEIAEGDEAGARALSELKDRGLTRVAGVAEESAKHVLGFFELLRTELGFYVCALNLRDSLEALGLPMALPIPEPAGSRRLSIRVLYDVGLALTANRHVVGNSLSADGVSLVIVTGANEGGKSTFLRSLGLAQLMMQAGLFVGAESFEGELCDGLFTHFTRSEDTSMERGKLDEELSRMSEITDLLTSRSLVLFNESFAATNEREGSAIATQVVSALLARGVKVAYVTHLHSFARGLFDQRRADTLFLRAERLPDGSRTFRVIPGEPEETSYGEDLYNQIFGESSGRA